MFKYIIYNYIDYLSFFLLSLGFSSVILGISFFVSINLSDFEKLTSYECGFDPFSDTREPLKIKFYLIAILFIIFDIEVIFFLPWVLCQEQLLLFGYYTMYILCIAVFTLIEIKVMASVQRRKGPNLTGFMGFYQPIADGLKLFSKEFIIHSNSNLTLFMLSPVITLFLTFFIFFLIPIVPCYNTLSTPYSTILLLVLYSLSLHGIIFSGWSSNSKYSFLGSIRTASQMVSYEICMSTIFLCIALMSGSFCFNNIIFSQYHLWFIIPLFPLLVFFLIIYFSQFSFKKKMSVWSNSSTINNMKIFSNRKCFYNVKPKNNNDNENINVSIKSSTHKVKFVDDESFDKDTYIDSKNVSLSKDSYSDSLFFKYFSFFFYLPFFVIKWAFYLVLLVIFIIFSFIYYFILYFSDYFRLLDRKNFFIHFYFFIFFFILYIFFIFVGSLFSLILLITCILFNFFNIFYERVLYIEPTIHIKKYMYSFFYICIICFFIYFIPTLLSNNLGVYFGISIKCKLFMICLIRFLILIYIYKRYERSVSFSFYNPFFYLNNLFFFSIDSLYNKLVSMTDDINTMLLDSMTLFYIDGMFNKIRQFYFKKKKKMNVFSSTKRKFSTRKNINICSSTKRKFSTRTFLHTNLNFFDKVESLVRKVFQVNKLIKFHPLKEEQGINAEKILKKIENLDKSYNHNKTVSLNNDLKTFGLSLHQDSFERPLIYSTKNYLFNKKTNMLLFMCLNEHKKYEYCSIPLEEGKTGYFQNNTQLLKFFLEKDNINITIFKINGIIHFPELAFFKLNDPTYFSKACTSFYRGADNHYCTSVPALMKDTVTGKVSMKHLIFVLSSTSRKLPFGSLLKKNITFDMSLTSFLQAKQKPFTFVVKNVYVLNKSTFSSLGKKSVSTSILSKYEWTSFPRVVSKGIHDGTMLFVDPKTGNFFTFISFDTTNNSDDPLLMLKIMCNSKHAFNDMIKVCTPVKENSFIDIQKVKPFIVETDVLDLWK